MPDLEIYTGAYGFNITIDTNLDLTGATSLKLRIKSPAGAVVTRNLDDTNVVAPATDGVVSYAVVSSDFTSPGLYKVQLSDETGAIKKVISDILKVRVRPAVEYVGP